MVRSQGGMMGSQIKMGMMMEAFSNEGGLILSLHYTGQNKVTPQSICYFHLRQRHRLCSSLYSPDEDDDSERHS